MQLGGHRNNSTSVGAWVQIIFTGFINSDKYIVQIQFELTHYSATTVFFDDVGLWSTLPLNQQRLEWVIIPTPITWWGLTQPVMQQGIPYQYFGEVFNTNGDKTENGTFYVTDSYGTTNGTLYLGDFNFTILSRTFTANTTEIFSIFIIANGDTIQTQFTVSWWRFTAPISDEGMDINILMYWIVYFCLLFLPTLMIMGTLSNPYSSKRLDPVLSFIIGLTFSAMITVLAGLDLWVLVVCIIMIGALIFGKREGYV